MAEMFIINVGNSLDDTTWAKVVIVPDGYSVAMVEMDIEHLVKLDNDFSGEFVHSVYKATPTYCAFDEDDFNCISHILKEFKVI